MADGAESPRTRRSFELSQGLATVFAGLFALVGVGIGHFVSNLGSERQTAAELEIARNRSVHEMTLQTAKQEHDINLERQKFIQLTISSILAKGTTAEQQDLLRFYADIGIVGEPYASKIMAIPRESLPTIVDPRSPVRPFSGALYGEDAEIDAAVFGIASHKLTSAEPARVIQAPSSKHGEAFAEPPRFIVVDFAAADFAQGVVGFLSGPDAPGSIHVLVDRDGTIYQMVPFDTVAFHAGRSEYRGVTGLNFHSIGAELLNNGQLKKAEDGRWMSWSDMVVPAERVFVVGDAGEGEEGWERYSEAQVAAVRGIVAALKQAYPSIEEVVTQAEVSPVKLGPGPAFPLDEVRQALR